MVDVLITPLSGTIKLDAAEGVSEAPGANKLWASGTNLYWSTTQVDGGGGGASSINDLSDALVENNSIWLGSDPSSTDTASKNTAVGIEALDIITTADENTVIGYQAGDAITTGGDNTAVGAAALSTVATGVGNTAMGREAMRDASDASNYNTAIGVNALFSSGSPTGSTTLGWGAAYYPSGNYNTLLGFQTGYGAASPTARSAWGNTAVGKQALYSITSANRNVAVGEVAGASITTATYNVLVGAYAGNALSTQGNNVVIGTFAGQNTTSTDSTIIGYAAGYNLSANKNVMVGRNAGYSDSTTNTAENSVGIGYYAINAIQDGHFNVAIGCEALRTATSAGSTVAIGESALGLTTTGSFNVAVGRKTLYNNTIGEYNTAVGHEALNKNVDGDNNTAIGYNALYTLEPSNGAGANTAVGMNAGRLATTGTGNVFIGYNAAYNITDTVDQVIIGKQAGEDNNENYNVFIGSEAALNATSVGNSVVIGRQAMGAGAPSGNNNVALGHKAAYSTTSGYDNICIGANAGGSVTTANRNIFIGSSAGSAVTTSSEFNIIIGSGTVSANDIGNGNIVMGGGASVKAALAETVIVGQGAGAGVSGNNVTAVGYQAAKATNTGIELTAIGHGALQEVTGSWNTAIGKGVMADGAGSGAYNTGVGTRALQAITDGNSNTAVGKSALQLISTESENAAFGMQAGYSIDANYNTLIGSRAGEKADGGEGYNTIVGAWAGRGDGEAPFDGDYNTIIGSHAMGTNALGTARYNTVLGFKAGYALTTGDSNVFIGYQAGNNTDYDTESDKLVIANSATTSPLIQGDFSAGTLNINGTLDSAGLFTAASGINVAGGSVTTTSLAMGVTVTEIKDEDNMASDSATMLATQQSIKAYVDSQSGGGGGSPGGSNTQVQYNNGGAFAGSANLTFASDILTVSGTTTLSDGEVAVSSGHLKVHSADDVNLDAHSGVTNFQYRGTETFRIAAGASSPVTLQPKASAFDLAMSAQDGTEVLRLDSANKRIGIGTTAPSTKLDVVGSITAGANSYTTISDNEYDVSSGDLLFDVAGDISLDAAGNDLRFKAAGTEIGRLTNSSSDLIIASIQNNKDMIFKGYDNLSYIQAAHFDMSDAGHFHLADDLTVSGAHMTVVSTDAGASAGPQIRLYRNSASPADNDYGGEVLFDMDLDSGTASLGAIKTQAIDVTNTSKDSQMHFHSYAGNTESILKWGAVNSVLGNAAGLFTNQSGTNSLGNSDYPFYRLYIGNDAATPLININGVDGHTDDVNWTVGADTLMLSFLGGVCLNAVVATSDEKLKEDISPYTTGLSFINQIEPKKYKFKENYRTTLKLPDEERVGFIAQDLEKISSDYVEQQEFEEENYLKPSNKFNAELQSSLINAIKELSAKNDALEARIAALEG